MRILVVCGLGGAGKSQLVLKYIHEYRCDYTAVFWIEAGSKESIERDYIQIYRLLYSRQVDTGHEMVKIEDAVPAVKRWFHGREGRWLVVLDSADTIDNDGDKNYIDLGYFMPDAPGVHIVITSRSSTAKEMTTLDAVEVAEMEPSEAAELLRRYAKLTEEGSDVIREVNGIVGELGYLALAITLAGSYVSVTPRLSSDIRGYLPEYRQRRKELLQRRAKRHIHQYGESVLSTWEASFEAIENHNLAAARLLSLLAFLNFEDIFRGLFDRDGTGVLESAPTRIVEPSEAIASSNETWQSFLFSGQQWTVYMLESAFETLQSYSLIQWKPDQKSYAMHKLVHAWGQDRLEADGQWQLSRLALELMAHATAKDQIGRSHQVRLVPHVMASFGIFSPLHESPDMLPIDRLAMIGKMEDFLFRIGRWSEAYTMLMFYLKKIEKMLGEKMLGKEHPDTLRSMSNLAAMLSSQGKYKEAEKMHRQVLTLREAVLGKEHSDTLMSMNHLGLVFSSQRKYGEAEKIHRRVLALAETVLGKEHSDTLLSMTNLAELLSGQGKYKEAEEMFQQVLALKGMVLSKEHPHTLINMNNLAQSLSSQGKYEKAEEMFRQVLALMKTVLGEEHPYTIMTMTNLAGALSTQGKYQEAEEISRKTLPLMVTVLGEEHPFTLTCVHSVAYCLHQMKRYKDAEVFYHRACTGYRKKLGENDPTTTACLRHHSSMLEEEKG